MKSTSSESSPSDSEKHFCSEPWIGIFSIETNQDVTFCPCYLKMNIGNLTEAPMKDIWNSKKLVELRGSFREGVLPEVCRSQVCPVVLGKKL